MKAEIAALPSGAPLHLVKEKTFLGRNSDNDIVALEKYVSRKHCVVSKNGKGYLLEDLDSSNGTYLNGRKIQGTVRLKNKDVIALGRESPAFEFFYYSDIIRKTVSFFRKPLNSILVGSGLALIIGFLAFILISRSPDLTEVQNGLRGLERTHGTDIFPRDQAFMTAVENWIQRIRSEPEYIPTLERRAEYEDMIRETLDKNGLSRDFALIAWAESGFEPKARNARTGAAGMWQFIPATARAYGLKVNRYMDERLDPARSTGAAALYLKDLVAMFGKDSFLLVLAAYNAGDATVRYGLKQIEDPVADRNFWYLYTHNLIPNETKQYVLKIVALGIIEQEM